MNSPEISVNMIVYNEEKYISEAIESILMQKFSDFEFIIVDDGSTDNTSKILKIFSKDKRIKLITNKKNMGRPYSRNLALFASSAPLIAIADSDDWCHPDRFYFQREFMQDNPQITVCGSSFSVYESDEKIPIFYDNENIRAEMIFNCPLANPSVMFRREKVIKITGGYNNFFKSAQDYDLWERLSHALHVEFRNLKENLVKYRTHPNRSRKEYVFNQMKMAQKIRLNQMKWLGLSLSKEELKYHKMIVGSILPESSDDIIKCIELIKRILLINLEKKYYNDTILSNKFKQKIISVLQTSTQIPGDITESLKSF